MRAQPGGGPSAASAAPGSVRPRRTRLQLLGLGLGALALLLTAALLTFAMVAARVPQHRAALEQLIRHETGLDISFSGLSVHWGWYGPEAVFHEVSVGDAGHGATLRAPELIVSLDAWRMARSGRFEAGRITFVNPDIDLAAARPQSRPPTSAAPEGGSLESAARLLARWRGDRVDLVGGTVRLPSPAAAPALIVNIRHAQLRRRAADWDLDARAWLPDSLGADVRLEASVHGDMAQPQTLQGPVRFSGERLVFAGWHAVLGDAAAAYLPGAGAGTLQLNAQLQHGAVTSLTGSLHAESLEWLPRSIGGATLRLPRLRAQWQATQRADGWVLLVRDVDVGAGEAMSSLVSVSATGTVQGVVRAIPLGLVAQITGWHDPQLPLAQLALGGMVREADFSWDPRRAVGTRLQSLAHIEALTVADAARELALSGLSARVSGNDTQWLVELAADAAQIVSSRGQPFRLDGLSVGAHLVAGADAARWHVRTADLEIRRQDMRVAVHAIVAARAPQDAGRVDAHIELTQADAVMLANLLGARMGDAFGVQAGRVTGGRITSGSLELHGPLYVARGRQVPGEFHGSLELREASLAGDESWPAVQDLSAHLDWRSDRATAAISHARSGSFQLSTARLQWDPRTARSVRFAGRLSGEAQEALQWLRDRPDIGRFAPSLQDLDLRGETLLDVDVNVPAAPLAPPRVRVTAVLDGTRLQPVAGVPPIQVQHGAVVFADGHLLHSSLTGQWLGGAVSLSVGERRERGATSVAISAHGLLDAHQAVLAAGGSEVDAPLGGSAEWTAQISIPVPGALAQTRWSLHADSALVGVASQLPEPFAKPAESVVPLHIELQGGDDNARLHVTLADRLRAQVALVRSADAWRIERGALRLGTAAPVLPTDPVFTVEGRVARLELPAYLSLWRATAGDTALPALQADVTATELVIGSRAYPEVRVLAHAARRGGELELQSALVSGSVRWPESADAQQPARLELARFEAESAPELLQAGELACVLAPATQIAVEDLRWQGRTLGRFTALVSNAGGELAFTQARLSGANDETRGAAGCRAGQCTLSFSLDSTDARGTLAAFGLRADLDARRASLSGVLHWRAEDASPLASLSGDLHMLLGEGAAQAQPRQTQGGSFPLFVVPALLAGAAPEGRAAVAPGVRFTRLAASFQISDGVASTSDLHLDGDAEILARARVGLVARDYQGTAFVLRGEERLPAALRALGPAPKIAAAWLALRDWLGGAGSDRSRIELRLRGTWDEPIVTAQ